MAATDETETVEDLIPDAIFDAIDHDELAIDRDSFIYWFAT
jgi:hypothetical protein